MPHPKFAAHRTAALELQVHKKNRIKKYQLSMYQRENVHASLFHSPARDRGTKFLRKKENLWMYLPSIESVEKIAGHMLQQGVMGSDIAYEELMSHHTLLSQQYSPTIIGHKSIDAHRCTLLSLEAHDAQARYSKKVLCVDDASFVPITEEWYASNGTLLKLWKRTSINIVEDIPTAHHIEIRDMLKEKTKTIIIIKEISYKEIKRRDVFSHRWLER